MKSEKINAFGLSVELIGAGLVSLGVFSIPLRLFGSELISELVIALF